MSKFLLYLITTVHIIFATTLKAQIKPLIVRIDYPDFIPSNTVFETSVVFKLDKLPKENLTLTFYKNNNVKVLSAYFNNYAKKEKLFVKVRNNKVVVIITAGKIKNIKSLPLQILLKCKGKGEARIEGKLFSIENINNQNDDETKNKRITRFYEPQHIAGNSIVLSELANLKIKTLNTNNIDNLFVEFWIKPAAGLKNFFSVIDKQTNDTLIVFSENNLGYLVIPLNENEILRNDVFFGKNIWNYLAVGITKVYGETILNVYVNSDLIYSTALTDRINELKNLLITFENNTEKKVELDRLKIWNFNNNIRLALKNKNFLSFEADSSQSLLQLNFDKKNELRKEKKNKNLLLTFENIEYTKSDAPIFSKAPKLTVTIGSTYNSIIWYVQEFGKAKKFILEKALNEEHFKKVYQVDAEDDPLKIYTFIDEILNNDEVSYYRVKQINKDGTEVMSAEVKIGKKNPAEFKVRQNYPNPFNPLTNIYVDVLTTTQIKVNVYDLVGNKIEQLYNGILPQGFHTFPFNGSNLPSGIYFFEVVSPHAQIIKKMILAK